MEFAGLNILDVFIGLFVVITVLRGARTGFLAGVFSLVGVVVGASVGSRIAPSLMPEDGNPLYSAGITLGSILAFAVLGEVIARTIGGSIRNRLSSPTSRPWTDSAVRRWGSRSPWCWFGPSASSPS